MTAERAKLKTRIESNWFCVGWMSRKDLELERKLHQSKWFDYRFISPMEATHQFRTAYSEIHQQKYGRHFSTEEAKARTGVRAGPAFQHKTELTSFWRARQRADLYGLPYKVFIEVAFDQLMGRGWARLPHVNQLYAERNLQSIYTAAAAYWEEFQQTDFDRSFSHLPEYRTESYHHFPAQVAHQAWVVDLLKEKKRSTWAIGKACLVTRVISPELALAEFGEEDFARAREDVSEDVPEPREPCGAQELLPSCLGLPGALVPTSPECIACPAMALCARMEAVTLAGLKRTAGSENPEYERRKKQQRDRTSRHRAKKALAAGASSAVTEPASAGRGA
jgi:hypothetical protein